MDAKTEDRDPKAVTPEEIQRHVDKFITKARSENKEHENEKLGILKERGYLDETMNQFKLMMYKWDVDNTIKYYENDTFCHKYCINQRYKYGCRNNCTFEHSYSLNDLINDSNKRHYNLCELLCLYLLYLKKYDDNPYLYYYCGALYKNGGKIKADYLKSEKYYLKSLSLDNEDASVHNNYAFLLENKLFDYDSCECHYKMALKIYASNAIMNFNFGYFLFSKRHNYSESLKYFDAACKLEPTHSKYHYYKGETLYKLSQFAEAKKELSISLELNQIDHRLTNLNIDIPSLKQKIILCGYEIETEIENLKKEILELKTKLQEKETQIQKMSKQNLIHIESDSTKAATPSAIATADDGDEDDDKKDYRQDSAQDATAAMSMGKKDEFIHTMNELLSNTNDINWVLCVININGLKQLNNMGNHHKGDAAIQTLKVNILQLCNEDATRFSPFKLTNVGDEFILLIKCKKNVKFVGKQLNHLLKMMNNSEYGISIGITGIFNSDKHTTYKDILTRANVSLKRAKQIVKENITQNESTKMYDYQGTSNYIWNKWDKKLVTLNLKENKNVLLSMLESRLPTQNEYKEKLRQLANSGDTEWVLAAMDGDSIGKINAESKIGADYIVALFNHKIQELCKNNKDICIGYQRGGDEYSLFIKCEKEDKTIADKIMNELIESVRSTKEFTISGGLTFLDDDETGRDWENRAEEALKKAKDNGKDQFCWQAVDE